MRNKKKSNMNKIIIEPSRSDIPDRYRKLNLQQKMYCKYYTQEGETFGNAYKSYSMAYDIKIPRLALGKVDYSSSEYQVCQAASARLAFNPLIKEMIEKLMLEKLNDNSVDSRLSGILHNGEDKNSINAIKIYNDLNNRVIKNMNIDITARPYKDISDEELIKIANE